MTNARKPHNEDAGQITIALPQPREFKDFRGDTFRGDIVANVMEKVRRWYGLHKIQTPNL